MKKIIITTATVLLTGVLISLSACKKDKNDEPNPDCKTCKALGGSDEQTVEEKVCSEEGKKAFADRWVGREVMCN